MSRVLSRNGDRPPTPNKTPGAAVVGLSGSTLERPVTSADTPGAFLKGKRVLTPSGKFMPRTRPISQLAARLRGVCTTTQEDLRLSTTPLSVSCGSPTLARQQLCSRGRAISTPPGTTGRSSLISKSQKTVAVPRLAAMESFLVEAAKLTNRSMPFKLIPTEGCTPSTVRTAFGEEASALRPNNTAALSTPRNSSSSNDLQMWWQNKILNSGKGPSSDPSLLCGIENITEQDQLPRAATLLHALLMQNAKIDAGVYPVIVEQNELVGLQPLHRLCRHTRVMEVVPEIAPIDNSTNTAAVNLVASSSTSFAGGRSKEAAPLETKLSFSGRGKSVQAMAASATVSIKTVERLHYYENAKHVIVSRGSHLYSMDIQDAAGRILESSELLKGFTVIEEDYLAGIAKGEAVSGESNASSPLSPLTSTSSSLTRMTFLESGNFMAIKEEVRSECKSNQLCIEALEGALLHLELSTNGAQTAEDPTLAQPDKAWYHGSVCALHVYPNGNAVLRASALTLDAPLLMHVASEMAHDANCDPMLEFVPEPSVVVQATRLIARTPTPTVGKKKPVPKKAAAASSQAALEIVVQEVPVKVPPPDAAPLPKRLPLWMPSSFHSKANARLGAGGDSSRNPVKEVEPDRLYNFTVQVKHEASLHTAVLLALKHMNPGVEFPLLHVLRHAAVRDPTLQMCVTNEVESALRHLSSFAAPCGPLRTEVERVCGRAVNSLTALLKDGTPHVSNFSRLLHQGLLDPAAHTSDTLEGELLGRADMHITRHPHHPDLLWCLRSPTWVDPSQKAKVTPPPMINYTIIPAGRSSLRTALGSLCNCSLAVSGGAASGAMSDKQCEDFVGVVKQFVKFVDHCAENEKKGTPVAKPFALRRLV